MSEESKPHAVNIGLKLFPSASKDKTTSPARKPISRRNGETSHNPYSAMDDRIDGSTTFSPLSDGRHSALDEREISLGERRASTSLSQAPLLTSTQNDRQTPQTAPPQSEYGSPISAPPPAHFTFDPPPRSQTPLSQVPNLVRSNSNHSHTTTSSPHNRSREEPVLRSIFPRYNPELPLEHQAYLPTQQSPTHIPITIINRRPYSPSIAYRNSQRSPPVTTADRPGRFPRYVQDETIMEPSTTAELKQFWKVVNGWKVSNSEGRKFCLAMTSAIEEPIHTLSSATQPFYQMKLIPTSTSAQMTLLRFDPNKTAKDRTTRLGSLSPKQGRGSEVMSTVMEETARRLPPNDGLVALLYPKAASDLVIDLANKPPRADEEQVIASAERECGRLVWDEDSGKYYLVHPAISTPFIVSIASSPAWSRVEYTLEHPELPKNLVRLVRDGAGAGFLEIDTGVAAKIDCFYVVDVAICAIMLVAITEEKNNHVERFEAPPSIAPVSPPTTPKRPASIWTRSKSRHSTRFRDLKMEEFEMDTMDLESQVSIKDAKKEKQKEEKIPGFFGLIWMLIKFFFWLVTTSFKVAAKIIIFLSKCLTGSRE